MSLPNLKISIEKGGLNRSGLDESANTGLVFYNSKNNMLTGTTVNGGVMINVKSVEEAVLAGIVDNNDFGVEHYQVDQYFKGNPNGNLYVGVFAVPTGATYSFTEIKTLQNFANGSLRRVGVITGLALATSDVNTLQGIATDCYNIEAPLSIYYSPSTFSANYTTLPDLRALTCPQVSVVIGQSDSGKGAELATSLTKTVSCIGLLLGFASSNISDNIGWIAGYNFVVGNENDQLRIGSAKYTDIPYAALNTIHDKGYLFLKKTIGIPGSSLNHMNTCSPILGNDYAYQTANQVIYEAIRNVRAQLKPHILSKVTVNKDGTLSYMNVQILQNAASIGLETLQKAGHISNYKVFVNPNTNVISTGKIEISIACQPVGYAEQIEVKIGLKTNL